MNVTTIPTAHPFHSLTVERLKEAKQLIDGIMPAGVFGVRIFYSALCLKETTEPSRPYRRRGWQTEAQAQRKQKKWIKRWGFVKQPCIFRTPQGFFAHPSFRRELEEAMAREQIIRERSGDGYINLMAMVV